MDLESLKVLLDEIAAVRSVDAKLVSVHACSRAKHIWIVMVKDGEKDSFIVWTWNTESAGLCHGTYDLNERDALVEFRRKVAIYGLE